MDGLVFIDQGHEYFYNGERVPSVTDICQPLGAEIDEFLEGVMDYAAERGTVCHRVLEMLLTGEEVDMAEIPQAYAPYIAAIRLFLVEHDIMPHLIEQPIYSPDLKVAGTPDLVAEFDGVLSLIDYKFVAQVAKAKVKAQLNGYLRLLADNGVFPEQLIAVQFLKDGTYRLYPVTVDDSEFMLCMGLHNVKTRKFKRGIID